MKEEGGKERGREAASPLKSRAGPQPAPTGSCDWSGPASLRGRDIAAQQKAPAAGGHPRQWSGAGRAGHRALSPKAVAPHPLFFFFFPFPFPLLSPPSFLLSF